MKILSIDPGINLIAWALLNENKCLLDCGIIYNKVKCTIKINPVVKVIWMIDAIKRELVNIKADLTVIEFTYANARATIPIIACMGFITGFCAGMGNKEYVIVPPTTWKGTRKKEEIHDRLYHKLDKKNKIILEQSLKTYYAKDHHNILDALALGIFIIDNKEKYYG